MRRLVDAFRDIFVVVEWFGEFVPKYLVACVICDVIVTNYEKCAYDCVLECSPSNYSAHIACY